MSDLNKLPFIYNKTKAEWTALNNANFIVPKDAIAICLEDNIIAVGTGSSTFAGLTNIFPIASILLRLTSIEGVNTAQNTSITNLETRASNLESENTTQGTNISSLLSRMTTVEGVNSTQTTNIEALQTRASNIEEVNTTQNNRLAALESLGLSVDSDGDIVQAD